jgi:hypothetical protein
MATYKAKHTFAPRVRQPGEAPPRTHNIFNANFKPPPAPPIRAGADDFRKIKSKGVRT